MTSRAVILLVVLGVSCAVANIVRPCQLNHLECIRNNLEANSNCNRNVRGVVPFVYQIPKFQFDTPFFNATYIDLNLTITNHDKCYVSEFFFNTEADSAVLAIDCPYLCIKSTRAVIQHRSLAEDMEYSYNYEAVYPMVRLTIHLRGANQLDICSAFTFADVATLPIFKVDPNNKKTENFLSTDLSFVNIFERETFYWRANQLARYYINSILCDFGCE